MCWVEAEVDWLCIGLELDFGFLLGSSSRIRLFGSKWVEMATPQLYEKSLPKETWEK